MQINIFHRTFVNRFLHATKLKKMKAIVHTKYGAPEVLQLRDVAKPSPKDKEVLIQIHATTVTRTDCEFRKSNIVVNRLFTGFFRPRKTILGREFSGQIEAIGKGVQFFKPGDEVFGLSAINMGAHAEYICISENKSIALKPTNMTHAEAASVCDGLMLGMNFIKNVDFSTPQKILINGASGAIGSSCVQLAHYFGADVTAVCNSKDMALITSLGARRVIDFTKEDFTQTTEEYDFVDTVGKSSYFRCKHLLKPDGVYISSELGDKAQNVFLPLWTSFGGGKRVKFPIPTDSKKEILFFKEIIEKGCYKAIIDRTYGLDQIVEATKYVETGMKTGNVVITVGENI